MKSFMLAITSIASLWVVVQSSAIDPQLGSFLHSYRDNVVSSNSGGSDNLLHLPLPPAANRRLKSVASASKAQSQELTSAVPATCDVAFMDCLPSGECVKCFQTLSTENIDWASVTPSTPCEDVVKFLVGGKHCVGLEKDATAKALFCKTFNACVVWEDGSSDKKNADKEIDCAKLDICDWPGFHASFIGDGVCNNDMPGCYNTEICGWDGGDCCDDTCKKRGNFAECGTHSRYSCKDPESTFCNSALTKECQHGDHGGEPDKPKKCEADETTYRLIMYDSFGDGWDKTVLKLTPQGNTGRIIYEGGLKLGSEGTEYLCLSKTSSCYHVELAGGIWGNEVSWEIKPYDFGAPAVADGGAPMDCTFPVGGDKCERTCRGGSNKHPEKDSDYRSYKDMYTCMETKCIIQVKACEKDKVCMNCMQQNPPEYCYADDGFNSVLTCGLCKCLGRDEASEFCDNKAHPSGNTPSNKDDTRQCTPSETLQGSSAVLSFANCTSFDQVGMMITDFDNNNFGEIDAFETCSHSYSGDRNHGGHTALGCMQILFNAMTKPTNNNSNDKTPKDAIVKLASLLYHDGENFCECSSSASQKCPLCPSFVQFKTLLYEAIDACHSLDEIDCDAWNEFYSPCKNNMMTKFGKIDFRLSEQCDYISNTCGGAGPFPAFRKLDCGDELPKESWDFYDDYAKNCLKGKVQPAPSPSPPNPRPEPRPEPKPYPSPTSPTKPYSPPSDNRPIAPYNPATDDMVSPTTPNVKPERKSHFFRNVFFLLLVGGVGFFVYKRRTDAFSFVRYRRGRNYMGGGESEMMYSGLSLDDSTSFEPPSLPPRPSTLG